uniref:PDZ domain-containing protein n=1 Tax=Rhinopithecus bieti TaxID=61621 RepID=A0A2K6KLA4_RHIBE
MSLYPSLGNLKVDNVIQAQTAFSANPANPAILSEAAAPISQDGNLYPKLYPELSQYMGLKEIHANVAVVSARPSGMICMVQGIREVILCTDQDGKIGLGLKSIDNDIFVQLVQANSPASLVGLRFGDQVLQINGENCAQTGFWRRDYHDMTIRDRPFERTITMHKDSTGHTPSQKKKKRKITSTVKNSSAARNGLLTEHNIYEINRQNVIGLKNSQTADILSTYETAVTTMIMPPFIFELFISTAPGHEHIIKRMAPSIMKSLMDHAIPEV